MPGTRRARHDKAPLTEAERENLVAYLDHELEDAQARAVEAKIQLNPAVRAEADQMKRAWDLLDYLPRAEPKADFTCRTMDRLTALRPIESRARRWRAIFGWAAVFLCVTACGFALCWLVEGHTISGGSTDRSDEIGRSRKAEQAFHPMWSERARSDSELSSPLHPGFLPEEVQAFVHDRLTPLLLGDKKDTGDRKDFEDAYREGGSRYIRTLLKLTDRYAPASVTTSIPKTRQQLAGMVDKELHKRLTGKDAAERPDVKALIQAEGRWPDFGIAVIAFLRQHRPKIEVPKWAHARPMDFEPAVQTFLDRQLIPALTPNEKKQLEQAEGQWPDYHRTMMKLAHEHGMSVPGMSLPGAPEFWDQLSTSLPDESDHLLLEFAAKMPDRDLAAMQFSLTDRARRERLKEEYYQHNPDRLQQRLLEDFQAGQRKN